MSGPSFNPNPCPEIRMQFFKVTSLIPIPVSSFGEYKENPIAGNPAPGNILVTATKILVQLREPALHFAPLTFSLCSKDGTDRHMDQLDRRLISLLRTDARMAVSNIAQELGVSRATVNARITKLLDSVLFKVSQLQQPIRISPASAPL